MMTAIDTTSSVSASGSAATEVQHARLRETIDEVIGSVFFGPLMRSMRSSTLKGSIGHGGRGEEVFRAQLDQVLVERAGRATQYELSEVLFNRFAPAAVAHGASTNDEAGK